MVVLLESAQHATCHMFAYELNAFEVVVKKWALFGGPAIAVIIALTTVAYMYNKTTNNVYQKVCSYLDHCEQVRRQI